MRRAVALLALSYACLLSGSSKAVFTPRDKAYYLDAAVIKFVRPGLVITITGAGIRSDGTIQAGETPPATQLTPYIIYGFGGSVNDFTGVLFPGNLADCAKCM